MRVSANSFNFDSAMFSPVNARNRIGESAGLTLRMDGGSMPSGRRLSAVEIADCTSWAAASMSRSRSNCSVMRTEPS